MISDFRAWLAKTAEALNIDVFDFMPGEMRVDAALVVGDIEDRSNDARDGLLPLLFTRAATVYLLVKIRDNRRAQAEETAGQLTATFLSELDNSTKNWTIQRRKSAGYTIGQFSYQGFELHLEFYQNE